MQDEVPANRDLPVGDRVVNDEVKKYVTGRKLHTNLCIWKLYNMRIHVHWPSVILLPVHLPGQQRVVIMGEDLQDLQRNRTENSKLLAFFRLCGEDQDPLAQTLTYLEIPVYFTWTRSEVRGPNNEIIMCWQRRKGKRGVVNDIPDVVTSNRLGRLSTVDPTETERFALRLLLTVRSGPESFDDIRTVNDVLMENFTVTAIELGLLDNDRHWDLTLDDAALLRSENRLRRLFVVIICQCQVGSPDQLWMRHRDQLTGDLLRDAIGRRRPGDPEVGYDDRMYNRALIMIEDICLDMCGHELSVLRMRSPDRDVPLFVGPMMQRNTYTDEDRAHLGAAAHAALAMMEPRQREVFNRIMECVGAAEQQRNSFHFLQAPGGTGKTFLINALLDQARSENRIAIAVASSGIAATLLHGGRTAHSVLHIPLDLVRAGKTVFNVEKGSDAAEVIRSASLLIWDEATMTHKSVYEAMDKTFRDIRDKPNCLFGGCTVLLAGDWRQILPVVPRAGRSQQVYSCVNQSYLWQQVEKHTLVRNMRAANAGHRAAGQIEEFSALLLSIGDGTINDEGNNIILPCGNIHNSPTRSHLIEAVYPNLDIDYVNDDFLRERCILATTNAKCEELNSRLVDMLPGEARIYTSVNKACDPRDARTFTPESLARMPVTGVPPHELKLKVGMPVILLRNIDAPKLCNGTRLRVDQLHDRVLVCTILTGIGAGDQVFIPKMPMMPSDFDIKFTRFTFPLRPAFVITLNKSQGQTFNYCGLDLEESAFSHGQVYVGFSRVGDPNHLFIYAPGGYTRNIVYHEVFDH